jgi:hypothetical protein
MADRGFSDDELRLYELLQQFLGLSDDTDVAGRIVLLGPNGAIVGDCTLSADDIEVAVDSLLHLNIERGRGVDLAEGPLAVDEDAQVALPDGLLPVDQPLTADELDAGDFDLLVADFEEFLKSEGGQA